MEPSNLIFIVDDNPTNIKVLYDLLRASGFRVLVAKSGETAIERLESVTPDLILLDIMMPGIDGYETCRRLKANPNTMNIPIIFMTALSDAVSKVKGLKEGAVDYITKPLEHQEVLARINTHLELYQLRQKLEQRVQERTLELSDALENLKQSQIKLQQSQVQLVHSEKMSALGNLVAGVAHEINNPVGFMIGNIYPAIEYINDLFGLIQLYQQEFPSPGNAIQAYVKRIDLDYVREDLPKLLESMQQGAERIYNISQSLRTFSRADNECKQPFNIHDGIDSTLLILRHRLKANQNRPDIEIVKNYGELPLVKCYPGQLNQVFMNLLANAIDALEELNQNRSFTEIAASPNCITIITKADTVNNTVIISIKDNGVGISKDKQQRIFDPAFTTKAVGKGTGLGLAIAKDIVVEKHMGKLECASTSTDGAEFIIEIPLL
ncbi:two-component hybrid sensor and regulator [Calothrix sp. NIES-4071]|nr:two-component hybrid sensor and regulator [Calothrix sp. NIES-4071]BAZ55401.1 two-component hybrid sensor and regulator [Calothrix sp. NIES-4105]